MTTTKLTKRAVEALRPRTDGDYFTWDATLPGFGVRVQPSGRKVYVVGFRAQGSRRFRRVTLGRHGAITIEQARQLAKQHLGDVAKGEDPASQRVTARNAPTVAELGVDYLAHVEALRSPATTRKYREQWEAYVVPMFGTRKVASITLADVAKLHRKLSDKPVTANRVAALLGAFFSYAGRQGAIPTHVNPTRGLERYAEKGKERFLTPAEFSALGDALAKAEKVGLVAPEHLRRQKGGKNRPKSADVPTPADPFAIAALRLMALTGARSGEVLSLRWDAVDLERGFLRLGMTKTGPSVRPLGGAAKELLANLPHVQGNPHVFPGRVKGAHLDNVKRLWSSVRVAAGLPDVRLHDLRHSFASGAAAAGQPLLVIGKLLGHRQVSTSAKYAHLADDPMRRAADETAGAIARAMAAAPSTPVTPLKRKRMR